MLYCNYFIMPNVRLYLSKCPYPQRIERRTRNRLAGEEQRKKVLDKIQEGHTWNKEN